MLRWSDADVELASDAVIDLGCVPGLETQAERLRVRRDAVAMMCDAVPQEFLRECS
jgi:hypothetical protein